MLEQEPRPGRIGRLETHLLPDQPDRHNALQFSREPL
jgi:hypothetical protein